jgi:tetratricopeptide (TPR) repeat protein/TolB-like protein
MIRRDFGQIFDEIPRNGGGLIGQTVSHYRIVERLGGGGMGVVYRAQDTRLDRTVALKFLPAEWSGEPLLRERFSREARAASALDHPHICTIFEIDETPEGQLFIAMAYCPGETLKQRMQRGPVAIDDAVDIAIQIGDALQNAHDAGIVHRDIKPANILITDRNQVKIVDFGLAKHSGELAVTRQGSVVGTPAYMSPEQANGDEVDGRSDIWAIGAVLYEMLAGRRAFAADHERAILLAITTSDPTPIDDLRPEVPAELLRIVRRCLKRDLGERYQNAGQLLADLRRYRGETFPAEIATVTLPSVSAAHHRSLFKHRLLPALAAVAVVVLAAMLYPTFSATGTRHLLVLPFNCPGDDAEAQILCVGLLDTVSAKLTELRRFQSSLAVVPASEVRGQRVQSADMAHRIFGVDLVVSGSVLRESNSLRIPIELVDATRLRQLRSRTITTDEMAGFVLQDRVVAVIEEMLDVELGAEERQALMAGGTSSAEAGELYLEARGRTGEDPSEGQLTQAMTLYRQALDLDPEYTEAMVRLADACELRYDLSHDPIWLQHGTDYARRAVAAAPDLPAAQLIAGRFELENSSYQEAIDHLQRAITLDPLGLSAYMYLADAYKGIGDPESADAAVDRAIRTGPEDWQTYYDLGVFFYERFELERAAGYFQRVVDLLPDGSIGYTALGGILIHLGDRARAREMLEKSVDIGPTYDGYNNLGTLEFYEGRYAEAASSYEIALELDDRDYSVWNNYAEALALNDADSHRARDAYERAAELAEEYLAEHPENTTALIDLASFHLHLGNDGKARKVLDLVLTLEIQDPSSMVAVADVLERLGDRASALEWIEKSLLAGYPLELIEDYAAFNSLVSDPAFGRLISTVSPTDSLSTN